MKDEVGTHPRRARPEVLVRTGQKPLDSKHGPRPTFPDSTRQRLHSNGPHVQESGFACPLNPQWPGAPRSTGPEHHAGVCVQGLKSLSSVPVKFCLCRSVCAHNTCRSVCVHKVCGSVHAFNVCGTVHVLNVHKSVCACTAVGSPEPSAHLPAITHALL